MASKLYIPKHILMKIIFMYAGPDQRKKTLNIEKDTDQTLDTKKYQIFKLSDDRIFLIFFVSVFDLTKVRIYYISGKI